MSITRSLGKACYNILFKGFILDIMARCLISSMSLMSFGFILNEHGAKIPDALYWSSYILAVWCVKPILKQVVDSFICIYQKRNLR